MVSCWNTTANGAPALGSPGDDSAPVVVGSAPAADEYGLVLTAQAASATTWATSGNEALVLEVSGSGGPLIGHVVLHQGAITFDYGMHAGALAGSASRSSYPRGRRPPISPSFGSTPTTTTAST